MLEDSYVTLEIGKAKHIALVAHDGKKKELVDWCDRNKDILKSHLELKYPETEFYVIIYEFSIF